VHRRWRPDVVVYLSRPGPRPVSRAGAVRPHVRVGATGFRPAAGRV
jgi:hypothetical protein